MRPINLFLTAELKVLKIDFFHILLKARCSLDPISINSKSLEVFKSKLLALIRPVQRSVYSVFNPQSLKYLTQLRLGLSNLNKHRFRRNFKD